MPTGQEKKAIATCFESNSAKAYAHWDNRQGWDVDLAAVAIAHLILLQERGRLNLVIWDSGGVSLFFILGVNIFIGSLAFDAFCHPPRHVSMVSKTIAPNIAC
jgi:hypothetical protein